MNGKELGFGLDLTFQNSYFTHHYSKLPEIRQGLGKFSTRRLETNFNFLVKLIRHEITEENCVKIQTNILQNFIQNNKIEVAFI